MTSPTLDIRPGMDMYSADPARYLGSVVAVLRLPRTGGGGGPRAGGPNPTGSEDEPANPILSQEQGAQMGSTAPERRGTRTLGEEIGPVPTMALGNTGPPRQSAGAAYATHPDSHVPDVTHMAVRPGRLNLGPLSPPVYVPVEAVCALSMERVVIELQGGKIPKTWRRRPDH